MDSFEKLTLRGATFSLRRPSAVSGSRVVLALHGLTGDEGAMGIFASHIPKQFTVVMPRGIFTSPLGGYSWVQEQRNGRPSLEDFSDSINSLRNLLGVISEGLSLSTMHTNLMGFSQGAALAYALLLDGGEQIQSISALSGFLPHGVHTSPADFSDHALQVFIAHGTQDELVPVEAAREAARLLRGAGAEVTYCESDVGHKLSVDCLQSLNQFYRGLL